jgi:Mrp family chromosome partitioning ATPase
MSALDNAFIRAYTLDISAAAPAGTSQTVRPSERSAPAGRPAPIAKPLDADTAPMLTIATGRTAVATAAKAASPHILATANRAAHPVVPAPHIRLISFLHTATTLESAPVAEDSDFSIALAEPVTLPAASSNISIRDEPLADAVDTVFEEPAANGLIAGFEVDRFAWPEICDALMADRSAEIDELAALLKSESSAGRKVIGLIGSRRGEGRSTLALLLARQLAAGGLKMVVVDADFEAPQLANRLSMTIEDGWGRTLADGLELADSLIESIADRVTLLPLAQRQGNHTNVGKPPAAEFAALHQKTIEQHLETLAKHFDIVLVDAGIVKAVRPDGRPRGALVLAGALQAAIMLSDARLASPSRVVDLHRRLSDSGIVPLGVVENFCQSKRT